MKIALIAALLMMPIAASAAPSTEQKAELEAFVKFNRAIGRIQGICSIYNSKLLHPEPTKQLIEQQLEALPEGGKDLLAAIKKEDPNCAKALS